MEPPFTTATPDVGSATGQALLRAIGSPGPSRHARAQDPAAASLRLGRQAATRAALAAGALALPPGPLGWLTVLPEMAAVWRLQARLVADVAAVHGQPPPSPETLLYCLFRHRGHRLVGELVRVSGERTLVQRLPAAALHWLAARLGARLARKLVGRGLARWLPLAGAASLAALAAWDTREVARTAAELYQRPPGATD